MADSVASAPTAGTPAVDPLTTRIATILGVTPAQVPNLSPGLIARAVATAKFTLPEEAQLELILPTKSSKAVADRDDGLTLITADGTRKTKWLLSGGQQHRSDFERAASPAFRNLPADMSFGNKGTG